VKGRLILLLFLLCFIRAPLAGAATFEFPHHLSSEQTISDDVYMIGETVTVKGKVIGDLIAIGKTVAYSGAVAADLLAAGLQIEVAGNINDDIRAAGLHTNLCGNIGDDAILTGFKVTVSPDSRIGHTAVVAAGQAVVNGHIRGDVIVTGYDCILGGDIQGNATISTAKLRLAPTTRIKGDLLYSSREPAVIPPGAIIEGEIIHHKPASPTQLYVFQPDDSGQWVKLTAMIIWDAGLIIIGLCLLLLVPQTLNTPRETMTNRPWLACIYGFLWLVGAPAAASVGIISIIGLPLAVAIVFLYLSSLYLSSLPVALWIGQKLFRTQNKPYLSLIIGLLIVSVLRSLPYIGFIIGTIVLTVGLGSFALSFRNYVRCCR
jgi:cytoskeletal protein CcmA (bactofilin family)